MRGLTADDDGALEPVFEALDRRLTPGLNRPVAIALSGGSDSLALLFAAAAWARARHRPLVALTVDHGLQSASPAFTAFAGAAAARLGVPWRALAWRGEKPVTGLPSAARRARHRLLACAARDVGAQVLLLGHTADDRREEGYMRLETPALGQLREWAPSPVWPEGREIFLLRPLLKMRREDLRGRLRALGAPWLEDPANGDSAFLRPRVRARLAAEPWEPPAPLLDAGARVGAMDLQVGAEGWIALPRTALVGDDAARLAAIALTCVAGRETPPRGRTIARALGRLASSGPCGVELAGASLRLDGERAVFARDPGAQRRAPPSNLGVAAGTRAVFDGRFEIEADVDLDVAPMYGRIKRLAASDREKASVLPPHLRAALPAVTIGDEGPSLPAPWGGAPARARALAPFRFAAALGLVRHEREIFSKLMAHGEVSSYLHP